MHYCYSHFTERVCNWPRSHSQCGKLGHLDPKVFSQLLLVGVFPCIKPLENQEVIREFFYPPELAG